jgi:hypothetical protein
MRVYESLIFIFRALKKHTRRRWRHKAATALCRWIFIQVPPIELTLFPNCRLPTGTTTRTPLPSKVPSQTGVLFRSARALFVNHQSASITSLRYERNFPLAVVEAKAAWKTAGDGMQQAKDCAEILGLKFSYATNGREIIEFDYFTGKETPISAYPPPVDLLARYRAGKGLSDNPVAARLTTPMNHTVGASAA